MSFDEAGMVLVGQKSVTNKSNARNGVVAGHANDEICRLCFGNDWHEV